MRRARCRSPLAVVEEGDCLSCTAWECEHSLQVPAWGSTVTDARYIPLERQLATFGVHYDAQEEMFYDALGPLHWGHVLDLVPGLSEAAMEAYVDRKNVAMQ